MIKIADMKRLGIFCLCILVLFSCKKDDKQFGVQPDEPVIKPDPPVVEDTSDFVFDISTVSQISLSLSAEQWNKLLANYDKQPSNNEYVLGKFVFTKGSKTYEVDSVGVRLRGNSSRRRPEGETGDLHQRTGADWHHVHFQVKFDEYRDKQKFCGIDKLILKWHKDDPAYCREIYCYDLFRRFGVWTAPRACYTRVTLNIAGDEKPAYFGVYALIEGVDKSFLKYRKQNNQWQSSNGNLWKANYGANLSPSSLGQAGISISTVDEVVDYVYNLKTNKKTGFDAANNQLEDFISTMNGLKSGSDDLKNWLEEHVAVDQFLRAYAVNVMVGMWDDYWYNQSNFYFYFDESGKFYFIPFDYDNTLGTSAMGINFGTHSLLNWGSLDGDRVLMRKVMSITEYKERYKNYIKQLASSENNYFATDKSIARITKWHSMISSYVSNDTNEDMQIEDAPAWWGNCSFYRLLSGNEQGGYNGDANWFKTKINSIDF